MVYDMMVTKTGGIKMEKDERKNISDEEIKDEKIKGDNIEDEDI